MIQIAIIISSFFITAYLEAEKTLAGHMINTAGKNRVLASQVEVELHRIALEGKGTSISGSPGIIPGAENDIPDEDIFDKLDALRKNIYSLKHEGVFGTVMPIPTENDSTSDWTLDGRLLPIAPQFDDDWKKIAEKYDVYHNSITVMVSENDYTMLSIEERLRIGDELIVLSDGLTAKLSNGLAAFSFQIILLQIVLAAINVATHVFLILVIIRVFRKAAEKRLEGEKFAALGEFAAILAHDMRNPLGTIYNSAKLVSKNVTDSRSKTEMKRIERSINRMSMQIEGVLSYLKVPRLELDSHSLKEMLQTSIDDVEIPDNIKVNVPADDIMIYCDAKKMEFVFTNLILNAVQAIGTSAGYITISVENAPRYITLSLEDSGDAIPEPVDAIFRPLYTTKTHGTGLGLTSCKNVIKAHNGKISARNEPVTFTLELPKDVANITKM